MESTFTPEMLNDATVNSYFVVVTPSFGLTKANVRDVDAIWSVYPNMYFNTGMRMMGLPEDISRVMKNSNYGSEDIDQVLATSITAENAETDENGFYATELANYDNWRREAIMANMTSGGLKLRELLAFVNPSVEQPTSTSLIKTSRTIPSGRTTEKKTITPKKGGGSVGRGVTALQEKIDKLDEGKLINVSKITEKGTGTTTAARPTKPAKTTYIPSDERLPFSTNNLEHFLIAVDLLPGGRDEYADAVAEAEEFFLKPVSNKAAVPRPKASSEHIHSLPKSEEIVPEKASIWSTKPIPRPGTQIPVPRSKVVEQVEEGAPLALTEEDVPSVAEPQIPKPGKK